LRLGIEKDSFEGVFPVALRVNDMQTIIDLATHIDDTFPVLFKNKIEAGPGIRQTNSYSGVYLLPLDGVSKKFSQMKTDVPFLFLLFIILIKVKLAVSAEGIHENFMD
jgi:hypothetical protein